MVSATTVIKNPSGLHLRPAGILCKEAFVCEGPDEEAALAAMVKIVEDGLGE